MSIIQSIKDKFDKYDISLEDIKLAIAYLRKYGYLPDKNMHSGSVLQNLDLDSFIAGIRRFQELANLEPDGDLGPKTMVAMHWPRCSLPDLTGIATMETAESRWGKKSLTYFIHSRDSDLSAQEWDAAIDLGFQQWCEVADLKITRTNSQSSANFIVAIGRGRTHNFDGPNGTLAWAQLPPNNNYNGQLLTRFDQDETWIVDPRQRGILLVNVACHEIGHLLGLHHSNVNTALMAPFYKAAITKPVHNDDVTRIVSKYGAPSSPAPTPTPIPDPTPNPVPTPIPDGEKFVVEISGQDVNIVIPGFRVQKIG